MSTHILPFLYVAIGGATGACLRYGISVAMGPWQMAGAGGFPVATLLVNVLGSLLMGLLAGLAAHIDGFNQTLRPLLMVGLLGGFTTFSSFSLDTLYLWERGEHVQAFAYVSASVVLSLLGFVLGMAAVRNFI